MNRTAPSTHPIRPRRLVGDDGAAMVEFALVVPVLALFLFGMLELTALVKNQTILVNALRGAARTDANVLGAVGVGGSQARWADRYALDVFRSSAGAMNNTTLNRVVIYKPSNSAGAIPSSCLTTPTSNSGAGVNNTCNIFNANQLASASFNTKFGSAATNTTCVTGAGGDWDQYWCPPSRKTDLAAGLDTVCVYAQFKYTYMTGVLPGGSQNVTDTVCTQAEPKTGIAS